MMYSFTREPKPAQEPSAAGKALSGRSMRGESGGSLSAIGDARRVPPAAAASEGGGRSGHDFGRIAVLHDAPLPLQAKLTVSAPGDRFEREADRMADAVMAGGDGPREPLRPISRAVQPKFYRKELSPEDMVDSMPPAEAGLEDSEGEIQRSAAGEAGPLTSGFEQRLQRQASGGGDALPAGTRDFMETRFGYDFSSVRIHHDRGANEVSQQVGARAFTLGNDIFFGRAEYRPESRDGQHLLAHELTHVVQQGEGRIARQIQRQTSCSSYAGYDTKADLKTYNCAGLALRTYLFTAPPSAVYSEISSHFLAASTPFGGSCGPGDVKFWLWEYDLHIEDSKGNVLAPPSPDFHIVGGRTDASGGDPVDVYSKNGRRQVYGPGTGPGFKPPARAPALSNDPAETPITHKGAPVYKVRSNFTEAITCAECHP